MSLINKPDYRLETAVIGDADEIARVINDAYSVVIGDSGFAFKKPGLPRISNPLDEWLVEAYSKGQITKAVDEQDHIVGAIYILPSVNKLYFGPYAVQSDHQHQGIGSLMLEHVYKLASELGSKYIEIKVINHRTDTIIMYEKLGFVKVGEEDYHDPDILTRPTKSFIYHKQLQ